MLGAIDKGIFVFWNMDPDLPMKKLNKLIKQILGACFQDLKKKEKKSAPRASQRSKKQ